MIRARVAEAFIALLVFVGSACHQTPPAQSAGGVHREGGGPKGSLILPVPRATSVLIETKSLSAVATYTSPTWAVGAYKRILIRFNGSASASSYFRLQANADAGLVYTDIGVDNNTAVSTDSAFKGTNGFARVGICIVAAANNINAVEFFPLTTGRTRTGTFTSMSDGNSATGGNSMARIGGFAYDDTATDITFITYSVTAATMTGTIEVYGDPA